MPRLEPLDDDSIGMVGAATDTPPMNNYKTLQNYPDIANIKPNIIHQVHSTNGPKRGPDMSS